MPLRLIPLCTFAVLAACGHARAGATSNAPAYEAPSTPHSIVVVTDRAANPRFAPRHALVVSNALRHFTTNTSWVYVDQFTSAQAAAAGAVVYLGDNGSRPLTPMALQAFRSAKVLVLTRYHLHQFRDAKIAFADVREGQDRALSAPLLVRYHGHRVAVRQADYVDLSVAAPAETVAFFRVGAREVPFIVRDGNATFINGTIDFDRLEARPQAFGAAIVIADCLNDALHAGPLQRAHFAMLRLEDVSVQTQAVRLKAIVEYLSSERVPYGIGVIPDQLIKGQNLSTLSQDAELVSVLTFAQNHGATIILHGFHHSFNSPEDFEFWDPIRHRALAQDSPAWMDRKISQGLKIENALGLHPRMWETPHYSASATDYREVSKYFKAAWEEREPNGWLPWPLQRDEYGIVLLPENLGYVANDGSTTVQNQLGIAKVLLMCRGCVAAGFLHPSTIPLEDFRSYVSGLRALGYQFADPGQFVQ